MIEHVFIAALQSISDSTKSWIEKITPRAC